MYIAKQQQIQGQFASQSVADRGQFKGHCYCDAYHKDYPLVRGVFTGRWGEQLVVGRSSNGGPYMDDEKVTL